ncbi:MAG: hypothetical protein L0Z47_09140 [Actinobacteria bacterium]|nr:hypothetical protein [Actinomycetota bacterium]
MVSRTCEQCGSTVAADEQFCPQCGAFMDPLAPTRAPSRRPSPNVISVTSDGTNYEEFSLDQPPVEPGPTRTTNGDNIECPSCHTPNPATNLHCQNCGARLRQGPLPTAPRPAVQATAGVRAALAISGLLLVVILVALVFNVFDGNQTASSTTVASPTTSTPAQTENNPIEVIRVDCDPVGLGSFACSNLIAGEGSEFQVNWEELEAANETLTITLYFREPMTVSFIEWSNISDQLRFSQNHRARGLLLNSDNQVSEWVWELENTPGLQIIDYAALEATWIEITITSTHRAEVSEGNVFSEIAIDEIIPWGRPALTTEG